MIMKKVLYILLLLISFGLKAATIATAIWTIISFVICLLKIDQFNWNSLGYLTVFSFFLIVYVVGMTFVFGKEIDRQRNLEERFEQMQKEKLNNNN